MTLEALLHQTSVSVFIIMFSAILSSLHILWLNSSTSVGCPSSRLTRSFSLPGPFFEGGRENSFV